MAPKIFVDYDEEIIDEHFNYQEIYDDLDNSITEMPALEPVDYPQIANVDSVFYAHNCLSLKTIIDSIENFFFC